MVVPGEGAGRGPSAAGLAGRILGLYDGAEWSELAGVAADAEGMDALAGLAIAYLRAAGAQRMLRSVIEAEAAVAQREGRLGRLWLLEARLREADEILSGERPWA